MALFVWFRELMHHGVRIAHTHGRADCGGDLVNLSEHQGVLIVHHENVVTFEARVERPEIRND